MSRAHSISILTCKSRFPPSTFKLLAPLPTPRATTASATPIFLRSPSCHQRASTPRSQLRPPSPSTPQAQLPQMTWMKVPCTSALCLPSAASRDKTRSLVRSSLARASLRIANSVDSLVSTTVGRCSSGHSRVLPTGLM